MSFQGRISLAMALSTLATMAVAFCSSCSACQVASLEMVNSQRVYTMAARNNARKAAQASTAHSVDEENAMYPLCSAQFRFRYDDRKCGGAVWRGERQQLPIGTVPVQVCKRVTHRTYSVLICLVCLASFY